MTGIAIFGALIALITVNPMSQRQLVESGNLSEKGDGDDDF
ncbi:hypothetical protein NON08_13975 [Cetobacterium somerae]|nr:hypothetical protein [Cetobacterium sp. NK01]MCQ8213610.1 hypothetical protein [Cetobacterium sp. NK01]